LKLRREVGLELDLLASVIHTGKQSEVYRIISGLGELNNFKDGGVEALSSSAQSAIITEGNNTD
jgi:hypothetical protein